MKSREWRALIRIFSVVWDLNEKGQQQQQQNEYNQIYIFRYSDRTTCEYILGLKLKDIYIRRKCEYKKKI